MSLDCVGWNMAYMVIKDLNRPWRAALHNGARHKWPKGHTGMMGKELYFLDTGCVNLRQFDFAGNEKILWYIRDNCIFGEAPFFCHAGFSYSHFTCAEECVIYSFEEAQLKRFMPQYPELYPNLVNSMAYKMRILAHQTASLILDSLLVRLCKFISLHLIPGSDPLTAQIDIPKQEIANIIGANRISLYKILKDQEEQGLWSAFKHGRIVIYNPDLFIKIVAS